MRNILTGLLTGALLATSGGAQQAADAIAPEPATAGAVAALSDDVRAALRAKAEGRPVEAEDWMIVAANPLAARAGADARRAG